MRWCDLLFAHYTINPSRLRAHLPAGLELDLFESRAYVGAVPFTMRGVSPRMAPVIPGLSGFPELNLRTYVTAGGVPGVWFFSLDAGQKLAVRIARRMFHLPYFDAEFHIDSIGQRIDYSCVRTHLDAPRAEFAVSYEAAGPCFAAEPGSLDYWLTERYCLYAADDMGQLFRGRIDHESWPLQPAEAEIRINTLGDSLGIDLSGPPAILHFAKSLDVHAWFPERI
jgi:uncharacterized protein YqjF (DUF2071 family)